MYFKDFSNIYFSPECKAKLDHLFLIQTHPLLQGISSDDVSCEVGFSRLNPSPVNIGFCVNAKLCGKLDSLLFVWSMPFY